MDAETTWDESQFEEMSWHDNRVYGLRLRRGDDRGGQLELDIDYILEWITSDPAAWRFRVAPATLTFREVYSLRIEIDYKTVGAALVPFSIDGIERVPVPNTEHSRWTIRINWPDGQLSFEATGFQQVLRAPAIVSTSQSLTHEGRTALGA
jgi:hypothetical protein